MTILGYQIAVEMFTRMFFKIEMYDLFILNLSTLLLVYIKLSLKFFLKVPENGLPPKCNGNSESVVHELGSI